jgi:hypothetical protein
MAGHGFQAPKRSADRVSVLGAGYSKTETGGKFCCSGITGWIEKSKPLGFRQKHAGATEFEYAGM